MDIEDLIRTDPIPDGAASVLVQLSGGGTIFGGVVAQFPSEVPILISFGGEGMVTSALDVTGDTGFVDNVQHISLHKSTNPVTGFNVSLGDSNQAIANFSSSFLELTDTPDDYAGEGDKLVRVKGDETGLEFITSSSLTSPLTTKGDIWGFSTTNARLPVGANGKFLMADSAQTLGVGYSTIDLDAATHKIINVTDPSSAQDAATKNYVDTHGANGFPLITVQLTGTVSVTTGAAQDITGLSVNLAANTTYEIEGTLFWQASDNNGGSFQLEYTGTMSATSGFWIGMTNEGGNSNFESNMNSLSSTSTFVGFPPVVYFSRFISVFKTTSTGTVKCQGNKSVSGTVSFFAGSYMTVTTLI